MFVALCILIWFPLLILSTGNPSYETHPVESAMVTFGIGGYEPLYSVDQNYNIDFVSSDEYSYLKGKYDGLRKNDKKDVQKITVDQNAETLWNPSPPTVAEMIRALQPNTSTMYVEFGFIFTRKGGTPTISYPPLSKQLSTNEKVEIAAAINGTNNGSVLLSNFNTQLMDLPGTGFIEYITSIGLNFSVNLTLNQYFSFHDINNKTYAVHNKWWSISQPIVPNTPPQSLTFYMISDPVPNSFVATIAANGIIGLYVGVVLSIGRFLRLWVSDLVKKIYLEEIPYVNNLMTMCDDIFLARQSQDFLLEEQLFRQLMLLFRSPERLLKYTKKSRRN